ncbi:MAG: hypothetical protein ACXAB4_01915 [Candidatus Hodarchaeales archaeon]|jgi:hypothetical protein
MPRLSEVIEFAENFVGMLQSIEAIGERDEEYWNLLEVNSPSISENMRDRGFVREKLSSLDNGAKQVICVWAGLHPLQRRNDENRLVEYIVNNQNMPGLKNALVLTDFLMRRRPDAIETISRLILPAERFNLVFESEIERNSKRFCYALLAFLQNPHNLRTLMLFESAERVGYQRYYLTTRIPDIDDQNEIEELLQRAQENIDRGGNRRNIDVGLMNDILNEYERTHGRKQSICFDVFQDDDQDTTLIFVFRTLKETAIREVEGTIFADEAELIVLRASDRMRIVDEHSYKGVGIQIATVLTSQLLDDANLQYIPSDETTQLNDLENLITALNQENDERIQFKEIYLETAPIEGSPKMILRSDEDQTITRSLEHLNQRNINLLQDFRDFKNIKIGFVVTRADNSLKSYIFKVAFKHLGQNLYYLTYSTANIASRIRSNFETHLRDNYNVNAIPGKG